MRLAARDVGEHQSLPDLRAALGSKRLLVLDYDGTIAHLDVDWEGARAALARCAAGLGFTSQFRPLWPEMARFKRLVGAQYMKALFQTLAQFEEPGVRNQRPRREIVDQLKALLTAGDVRMAVLSMNLHQTIEAGLEALGLAPIRPVLGCDDVEVWKPEPDGLLGLLAAQSLTPGDALFLGDTGRDRATADAAGVDFLWA